MRKEFILCLREADRNGEFLNEPGLARHLVVPGDAVPTPDHAVDRDVWANALIDSAGINEGNGASKPVNVLLYIHGYNTGMDEVLKQHHQLCADLVSQGFGGTVASFDWPSHTGAFKYWHDRQKAKQTAICLISEFIQLFCPFIDHPGCNVKLHLLGHSIGAYVIREAFMMVDGILGTNHQNWMVNQIAFVAGDVSSPGMAEGNEKSAALYRHCSRLTNYYNPQDYVLNLARVAGVTIKPRAGLVGAPDDAPEKVVDVNCETHFLTKVESQSRFYGTFCHSWHIGDPLFTRDLLFTIKGTHTEDIPTRHYNHVTGKWVMG